MLAREPFADVYTGTAAALIAAGLVTEGQLPGQPGRPAHSVTYRDGEPATNRPGRGQPAGYMRIHRTRHGFRVYIATPNEARIERIAAALPKCAAEAEAISDEEFRASAETLLIMAMRFVFDHSSAVQGYTPKPRHRQRFTDADRDSLVSDLRSAHARLMAAPFHAEGATPSPVSRMRMDAAFERLLRSSEFRQHSYPD